MSLQTDQSIDVIVVYDEGAQWEIVWHCSECEESLVTMTCNVKGLVKCPHCDSEYQFALPVH